jgi:hypothetical protein
LKIVLPPAVAGELQLQRGQKTGLQNYSDNGKMKLTITKGGGEEMNNAVLVRGDWMSYLSICRAIFHEAAANGTSLPIFSNFIWKTKR